MSFDTVFSVGDSVRKAYLPSLLTNSDLELADNDRKRAAEFGRYVSNEADNSINGFKMPYSNIKRIRRLKYRLRKFSLCSHC